MAERTWAFDKALHADVILDENATVRAFLATQQPKIRIAGTTSRETADNFLREHGVVLGVDAPQLTLLNRPPRADVTDLDVEYRFLREKPHSNLTTVVFQQTYLGLPIWQAGISLHLQQERPSPNWLMKFLYWLRHYVSFGKIDAPAFFQVIGALSTRHDKVAIANLQPNAAGLARLKAETAPLETLKPETLAEQLGIAHAASSAYNANSVSITHQRLMIYRYRAADRDHGLGTDSDPKAENAYPLAMPLPPVPSTIIEGSHYIVGAVYFDLNLKDGSPVHWVALVEANTLSVLYLEAFIGTLGPGVPVGPVKGMVFLADPVTTHGGPMPGADEKYLNPLRVSVDLPNLQKSNPQKLDGSNITIIDFDDPPHNPPPTMPPAINFDFGVHSDDFAAVNAYFHCDRFFRFVEDVGFTRAEYFSGTTFPIPIDPRGRPKEGGATYVSAECRAKSIPGPHGDIALGIKDIVFALAQPFTNTGNANDWRIVLHELGGHGTLQNHIQSSWFKFAHSAGDSFAAILNDPESHAPASNKGVTFPWITTLNRCHNQPWLWDGSEDRNDGPSQYNREQILSTTHFRLYQSIGGGNATSADVRWDAATYTAYLILRAIMTLDHNASPEHAADWMVSLVSANEADWPTKQYAGGAYSKVIRWAFEKQGLFGGSPPGVDVYIDDGRGGEYQYQPDYLSCPAIWNRQASDDQERHQTPKPKVVNYAYVKIKNRGSQTATSVLVSAFLSTSQTNRNYPNDWPAMSPPLRSAPDVPPNSQGIIVGPFEWIPSSGDNFILMAVSAEDDPSNLDKFSTNKSIPDWRLVPHDNNLGMRKV